MDGDVALLSGVGQENDMDEQALGNTLDELVIQDAVKQLLKDAYLVWGSLNEDRIERLAGALHRRFEISREQAHAYMMRMVHLSAGMNGSRRD